MIENNLSIRINELIRLGLEIEEKKISSGYTKNELINNFCKNGTIPNSIVVNMFSNNDGSEVVFLNLIYYQQYLMYQNAVKWGIKKKLIEEFQQEKGIKIDVHIIEALNVNNFYIFAIPSIEEYKTKYKSESLLSYFDPTYHIIRT